MVITKGKIQIIVFNTYTYITNKNHCVSVGKMCWERQDDDDDE